MEGGSKGLWRSCPKVPWKEILPCQIWDTPHIGAATHALHRRRLTQGTANHGEGAQPHLSPFRAALWGAHPHPSPVPIAQCPAPLGAAGP